MKNVTEVLAGFTIVGLIVAGLVGFVVFLAGCTQQVPVGTPISTATKVESSTQTSVETGELKAAWPNKEWTKILSTALDDLGQPLLTGYFEGGICGNRKQFFVMLISEMARYESSFNPNAKYQESFPDSKGNPQISAGLLQMSFDDAKNNGVGCDFKRPEDVFDVRLNLRCGVKVLTRWVVRDGKLAEGHDKATAKGAARYWSVMRTGTKKDKILAAAKATCK